MAGDGGRRLITSQLQGKVAGATPNRAGGLLDFPPRSP